MFCGASGSAGSRSVDAGVEEVAEITVVVTAEEVFAVVTSAADVELLDECAVSGCGTVVVSAVCV